MGNNRIIKFFTQPLSWQTVAILGSVPLSVVLVAMIYTGCISDEQTGGRYRVGLSHFKVEGGKEYLRASRAGEKPEWFDITGSPLDKHGFQFGIGKDTIPSIDDPVFVKPDDPRLL
ncbi:MAG: hypothetical protein V3W34_15975, partial [Phycisphaerae bacterium]